MLNVNCFQLFETNVPYDKPLNRLLGAKLNLLSLKEHTSFGQTLAKIKKSKNCDFVFVQKPQLSQMAAILLARLAGRKFIWAVNFQNPPQPGFFSKLLIAQADKVITTSKKDLNKLVSWGVQKSKILTPILPKALDHVW